MSENSNPQGTEMTLQDAANALLEVLPDEGEQEIQQAQDESPQEDESEVVTDESEGEETEEQDEDQEQPTAQTVRVKVDGEEMEVTLDELKNGYSREQTFTKRMQELAEKRKGFEAEIQAVVTERQQYGQLLSALAQQLQEPEPDWDTLRNTDPIEYSLQMADWQRKQQKLGAVYQEQARLAQLQQVQQQQQMAEMLKREQQALTSLIPEWKDEGKAKAEKAMVLEQGKKLGYSEQELSQVFDHRAVLALRKAALYDQLMSKRQELKTKPPQKVLEPGTKPRADVDRRKAVTTATRSGNIKDAASAIELLLRG